MTPIDPNAIINVGELAKPATTLIEKISDAIGGIARPWQIKRVAQAEAEADKIRTVAKIETTELEQRAMRRLFTEEAKKQNNMEGIIAKALPEVSEQSKPADIEDDWIANFFEKCRLISDEEMQKLWAKVLAGEANSPGNFSKRTINLLGGLDKTEASWFAQVCSFAVTLNGPYPLIYDFNHPIYLNHGVNFTTLTNLSSVGLISLEPTTGFQKGGFSEKGYVSYFDQRVWVQLPKPEGNDFQLGKVILTHVGNQLAPLCGAYPIEGFTDYLKEKWKTFSYKTEPPVNPETQQPQPNPS